MTTTYIDALGDQLTDADKLRILADWHDAQDDKREFSGAREVQRDLRRMADALEAQQAVVEAAEKWRDHGFYGETEGGWVHPADTKVENALCDAVDDYRKALDAPPEGDGTA